MTTTQIGPNVARRDPPEHKGAHFPALRRYIGAPGHQVHLTQMGAREGDAPNLYCLHATAYSGQTFLPFMRALAPRRAVLAPDMPGYGGSDAPARRLTIEEYAGALGEALALDSGGGPIDVLGYHTGALVAAELARRRPELVRRLVLIGIPFFQGAEREHWRRVLATPTVLTEALGQFEERWAYFITQRPEGVLLRRAFANFVDELRAYPDGWWAHEAAFTFEAERCFPEVTQPTLVVNPDNHLSEASRRAAACMPDCRVVEVPTLDHAIFDIAPELLSELVERFLTGDVHGAQGRYADKAPERE